MKVQEGYKGKFQACVNVLPLGESNYHLRAYLIKIKF